MHPALIAVIIFAVVLSVVGFLMRTSTLEHVEYAPGETILREFHGLKVESGSMGPRRAVFLNCRVILTGRRTIIAQKILFFNRYQTRYILHLGAGEEAFSLEKGVVNLRVTREKIRPVRNKGKAYLQIIPEGTGLMPVSDIMIFSENPEEMASVMTGE